MADITQLDSVRHAGLKVRPDKMREIFRRRHLLHLRAEETVGAACCFPVFLVKTHETGDWILSALAAFEQATSLFVDADGWHADYQPGEVRTHPFFLLKMPAAAGEEQEQFAVSFDASSPMLSTEEGEALFDDQGRPSLYLDNMKKSLDANLKRDYQTWQFIKKLRELKLFKSLTLMLQYQSGKKHRLQGLHTVDEDRLQALAPDDLKELRDLGYLAPVYAMLMSLSQLNALLNRHNRQGNPPIARIRMEATKAEETA